MPANGTKFRASATAFESVASHAPTSNGSSGMERRSSQNIASISSENTMPAMAVTLGVFNCVRVRAELSGMSGFLIAPTNRWRS